VIEAALNTRSAEARREKKLQLQTAIKKFNRNPEKGIEYLVAHGLNEGTPADIAHFLRNTSGLNRTAAGDYLSDLPEVCRLTLRCFLSQLTFAGTRLVSPPLSTHTHARTHARHIRQEPVRRRVFIFTMPMVGGWW
jgi:Sec7-like guanine-nucleotide exchange factor